jgi:hypothetical protein
MVEIELKRRQHWLTPTRKSAGLATSPAREKEGKRWEARGGFIGMLDARFNAREWPKSRGVTVAVSGVHRIEVEDGDVAWQVGSTCQWEREKIGVLVRDCLAGPRANSGAGPDCFPGAFSIFVVFSPFLFSVFLISNYIKQNLVQKGVKQTQKIWNQILL